MPSGGQYPAPSTNGDWDPECPVCGDRGYFFAAKPPSKVKHFIYCDCAKNKAAVGAESLESRQTGLGTRPTDSGPQSLRPTPSKGERP